MNYHKLIRHFASERWSDQIDINMYSCDVAHVTTGHYGESLCNYCKAPLKSIPMWVYTWGRNKNGKITYKQIANY